MKNVARLAIFESSLKIYMKDFSNLRLQHDENYFKIYQATAKINPFK